MKCCIKERKKQEERKDRKKEKNKKKIQNKGHFGDNFWVWKEQPKEYVTSQECTNLLSMTKQTIKSNWNFIFSHSWDINSLIECVCVRFHLILYFCSTLATDAYIV